jgi:spore germination protein YaaH
MAEIEVGTEIEGANHWSYKVRVFNHGRAHDYEVTLSWSDYDLWSHGRLAPSRVVEKAFEFLLAREPAEAIMKRFDCSVIRRYFPEVDTELAKMR